MADCAHTWHDDERTNFKFDAHKPSWFTFVRSFVPRHITTHTHLNSDVHIHVRALAAALSMDGAPEQRGRAPPGGGSSSAAASSRRPGPNKLPDWPTTRKGKQ